MDRSHIDIMLDLETLSLDNKATIIQIAASSFDLTEGDLGDEFNRTVNPMSGIASGSVIDGPTIEWWMKQDRQTINNVFVNAIVNGEEIRDVLQDFASFVKNLKSKYQVKTAYLWGNGSKADNVWLENAFKLNGIKWPFHYRDDMDLRTLIRLGKEFGIDLKDELPFQGNKHVAMDDVKNQIRLATETFKVLRRSIKGE